MSCCRFSILKCRRRSSAPYVGVESKCTAANESWIAAVRIGELASELVHIGLIAMTAGCDATVFGELSFNVPTLGALYQDATWRLINERRRAIAGAIE